MKTPKNARIVKALKNASIIKALKNARIVKALKNASIIKALKNATIVNLNINNVIIFHFACFGYSALFISVFSGGIILANPPFMYVSNQDCDKNSHKIIFDVKS